MQHKNKPCVIWGTFDTGKPRVRILKKALTTQFEDTHTCHYPLWTDIEDKSQLRHPGQIIMLLGKSVWAYMKLVYLYLRAPAHEHLFVLYPGILGLILIYPFAKIRGAKIHLDLFISFYDTIAIDRKILSRRGIAAKALFYFEKLAIRLADICICDTNAHADYYADLFKVKRSKFKRVFVGVENEFLRQAEFPPSGEVNNLPSILFYGQFIPLHGIDIIVQAAKIFAAESAIPATWKIIGSGQTAPAMDRVIAEYGLSNIERIPWVKYEDLISYIATADVCLGIFAGDGKALRVIPNKVFQIVATGQTLITADSPAIRELLTENESVRLITPGDPQALADEVESVLQTSERLKNNRAVIFNQADVSRQIGEYLNEGFSSG